MDYYVSPDGSDADAGTLTSPFRTLTRAAAALEPGDACILRGGVYREVLRPERPGEPGRPIVFRAFESETPVISTCEPLGDWRQEEDGLWSAPMPVDLEDGNQVFADGQMLPEARWPDDSGDLLRPVRATASGGSETTLTDPDLTGNADQWTGALLWCSGGHNWICWAKEVTGFDPDTHTLTFESAARDWYTPCEGSEYVLMGARAALDRPGEWWVDRAAGRIWLVPPEDRPPAELGIEARTRRTAIDLAGLEHIHLCGLRFTGGGLRTDESSRHLRLEGLRGEHVAHSYRRDASDEGVVIDGSDHVVRGCDFGYSSGSVVRLQGRHHKLLGNHVHHGNYGGLWRGTMALAGRRHVVAHNTVAHSGRDLVSVHGLMESLIEHNDLSHAGWLTHDLGITYGHNTDFAGTVIRRNRVHDCVAQGLAEGIYFDHCSHNVVVCENLIWNIPAMPIQVNNPGHFNLIAHNSCYNTNTGRPAITSFDHSHRQDLFGCRFANNLVNGPFELPDNGAVEGNRVAPDPGYVEAGGQDFSLRDDSPAVGAAKPIAGLDRGGRNDQGAVPLGQACWAAGWDSGLPVDETVEWVRPDWAHTNRLVNAAFEFGTIEAWQPWGDGELEIVPGNGWGNTVSGTEVAPTGTSHHELQLSGRAGVEQTVDLPPGTRFGLSGWLRAAASAAPVVLEVEGAGIEPIRVASGEPQWTRVALVFTTGADSTRVTARVRQDTEADDDQARADNLGLVEAD